MKIDSNLLDELSAQAQASSRLRVAFDLKTTPEDSSQRILNAMEPGTLLPIHRYRGLTLELVFLGWILKCFVVYLSTINSKVS